MPKKKNKKGSEEESEKELQERLKKEGELFQDLFGVTIEDATEDDIEETLSDLEKIEKEIKVPSKTKEPPKVKDNEPIKKIQPIQPAIQLPKPKPIMPIPRISEKAAPPAEIPPKTSILVKRGFDFIGGDVRFKVVVQNLSNMMVSEINVTINPTTQFMIDERVKTLNLLKPGESRGIDFTLTPLDCGTSKIYGSVSYVDFQGHPYSITIEPKELQIKCPLVQPSKHFSQKEVDELKKNLQKSSWAIEFLALTAKQAHDLIREQISALDVTEIHEEPQNFRTEWTGLAKVTGQELIIVAFIRENMINLEVYSQDVKQATGLLAYIKNILKLAIDNAQKIGGTVEQIGAKILDSFEICKKIIQLASLCEIQTLISDIISVLKEIEAKLRISFPETKIPDRIKLWTRVLSEKFDLDTNIEDRLATELEFDIIKWLNEIRAVTKTNAKIYQETFSEYAKLGSIKEGLEALFKDIDEMEERYNLKILRYLIVVLKSTGITVFREKLGSDVELDPFLVSGFLSAISSFGTELSRSKKETMMKKLTYADFEINIEEGEYVRAALLSQGKGTKLINDRLLDYIQIFEENYDTELITWSGNMSVFRGATEILPKVLPGIKIYPPTEGELKTISVPELATEPPGPQVTEEERFSKDAVGTLKVVSFPKEEKKEIEPKQIKLITPKPLFATPKIQIEQNMDDLGQFSEFRCSYCGAKILKKDLDRIEMGFIIPCPDCGGDLIGEALKKLEE